MAQAGTNRRPDSFDDAPNDRQAFLSSTDNLNPARFGSYSRLLVVLLFILLYVLVTLLALMLTGYLNNRTFNIDKIGLVSTLIVAVSQTFNILITSAIVYLGKSLSFQYLIYRDNPAQTLASLHYSLSSFNGAISASEALWATWRLKGGRQGYLILVLLYVSAIFVLQQATPTIVSVDTAMSNTTISIKVTKLFDDGSSALFDFSQASAKQSLGGLPFIWGNISVGPQLPGLNGSVFFSYPTRLSDENDVYLDHDARQLTTHCETFPFGSDDDLSIGYHNFGSATEIQQSELLGFIVLAVIPSLPYPNVTYIVPWFIEGYSMNPPRRQFGGAKPTRTSPPVMNFQGVLTLQEFHLDGPILNRNATAFLYINSNSNALQVDPSLNISAPLRREKQVSVWSWLPEDVANITSLSQTIPNAFEETANVSLNVWPMVCTLSVLNVTAQVNGNGQLLSYWPNDAPGGGNEPVGAAFSTNWANMLNTITSGELFVHLPGRIRNFWLEDQIVSALNASLSGAPDTTRGSITTLETRLSSLSALGYTLFSGTQAYQNILNITSSSADPRLKTVAGVRTTLRGRLSINSPQLFVALGTAFGIAVFLGTLINDCRVQLKNKNTLHDGSRGETIDMTGATALDVVALMDGSELPNLLKDYNGEELKERAKYIDVRMELYEPGGDSQTSQTLRIRSIHLARVGPPNPKLSDPRWHLWPSIHRIAHVLESMQRIISNRISKLQLPPGFFSTLITLGLLISFHVVFAVLYARHFFDTRVFSLSRIRIISQVVTWGSQLVCIALMVLFQSVLQKMACNIGITNSGQMLADLSDMILAWSGFGGAAVAGLRNFRTRRGLGLGFNTNLAMVIIFNVAVALLNISMPALLFVSTSSVNRPTTTLAQPMLGKFFTSSSWTATGDVDEVVATLQHMEGYFNGTTGMVQGWNNTVFHSIPANNSASNIFKDEYASQLVVQCRYLQPPEANTTFQVINSDSTLVAFAHIEHALPPNLTQTFNLTTAPNSPTYNYTFGGSKPSKNSPPNIHFPDMVMLDVGVESPCYQGCMSFGNIAVGYLTLRPNGLAPPAGVELPSPMTSTVSATVVSWIGDAKDRFNETVNVTFYLYPLICSPYLLNTTAHILGNGTLLSHDAPPQPPRGQTPFQRGMPTTTVERNWPYIVASLISNPLFMSANVTQWFEHTWQTIVARNATTEAIEHELALITSMVYAIAVLDWKTQLDDGNPLVTSYWTPSNVTLEGYQPETVGILGVNFSMLIIGCACSGVLVLVAGFHMKGWRPTDGEDHDGSIIDLISMLHDSELPRKMGAIGAPKRQKAQLQVIYGNNHLDAFETGQPGGASQAIPMQDFARERTSSHIDSSHARSLSQRSIETASAPSLAEGDDDTGSIDSSDVPPSSRSWRRRQSAYSRVSSSQDE